MMRHPSIISHGKKKKALFVEKSTGALRVIHNPSAAAAAATCELFWGELQILN
jgi:hypothetical protein